MVGLNEGRARGRRLSIARYPSRESAVRRQAHQQIHAESDDLASLQSDTRDCITPSTLAASACVMQLFFLTIVAKSTGPKIDQQVTLVIVDKIRRHCGTPAGQTIGYRVVGR